MAEPLIDWTSDESHVFINPLLPKDTQDLLQNAVAPYRDLKGHIWLASSGTESFPKMIALSKKAMLISANGVNHHLLIEKKHPWLNVLPLFHAGGLGIHARALLTDSQVFDFSEKKWNPTGFVESLEEFNISFSSLTPTHVYDLVSLNLRPPKHLEAIIVGGGELPKKLHEEAFALGWPLLKSYGMTETCSQIATALHSNPETQLVILNHVELRFNAEEFIEVRSEALLTGYVHGNDPLCRFIDPKVDGWYTTQDKGRIEADFLQIFGRGSNFIKIGGENINFSDLETVWENIKVKHHCHEDVVLIDLPDERLGRIVCLAIVKGQGNVNLTAWMEEYRQQVLPIAKIRDIYQVEFLPRTELFKLKKNELREMIMNQKKNEPTIS